MVEKTVKVEALVTIEVPDDVADQITSDDMLEMAQDAVCHSFVDNHVHLIVNSIGQWVDHQLGDERVMANADVEVTDVKEECAMKLFIVTYDWEPAGMDCTVLLAESLESARGFVKSDNPDEKFTEFATLEQLRDANLGYGHRGFCVREVETDKAAEVYTGYHCC